MNYGKALKVARAIAGLQQKEVAELAGLTPSYVSLIEMGKRSPSQKTVEKLSRALKLPSHLFTLLAAEDDDLELTQADELSKVGESLTRILLNRGPSKKHEKSNTAKRGRSKTS
jgi:transcriptional regulator with XRE-family HTH domain